MNQRVVAVVVTWNRQPLLERLLAALERQSRQPDLVLVVDNASTDGTASWLRERAVAVYDPQEVGACGVRWLRLERNTGGAGGFHAGLAAAMEQGAELAWLMDDDGLPGEECLEQLLRLGEGYDFFGPLVVAQDAPERLCFPIRPPGSATVLSTVEAAQAAAAKAPQASNSMATKGAILPDIVIPFNGVLITAALVTSMGLPREEFFIWGDDVEYLWRARRRGANVGTAVDVRFAHPATDELGAPMMAGKSTYNHSPSDLKHYCLVRNNYTNLRDYHGTAAAWVFLVKTAWFYSVTRRDRGRLRLSLRAWADARRGDFTGHQRYLP